MAISTGLKQIDSGATGFQKTTYTTSSSLSGNKLLFTYANRSETSTPYGNLFKSFNFPITATEKATYNATYGNNALKWLNTEKIIVVEIPKGEYGELIDGKTFQLTLPVTLNSIQTATTIYGSYFGYIGTGAATFNKKLNSQLSERNTNPFGSTPDANNDYNSNVTFLFCNDVTNGKPKSLGDSVTLLTSSITLNNTVSNKITFTAVTFSAGDSVYVEIIPTNSTTSISDINVEVSGELLTVNGWKTINTSTISNQSPSIYQNAAVSTPKNIQIIFKKRNTENLSWNVWSSPSNKFPTIEGDQSKKIYAIYDGINSNGSFVDSYDKPVGILYQDKGIVVITDTELVNGFRYSAGTSSGFNSIASGNSYTGDINFAKIYFTSSSLSTSSFDSITTEFVQNIICVANANEFVSSTNSTYATAYDENATEKPVFITSIGLWNANGELIGIGKLSEPVKKLPSTIVPFNIKLVI